LSKVGEIAIFAPLFLLIGLQPAIDFGWALLPLAGVGAALTLANYVGLALAYERGELSVIYPVSRGGVLLFLPPLGYLTLGERIDAIGIAALALIVIGIIALQLPALSWHALRTFWPTVLRSPATGFAMLASLAAAAYTLWDKRAVLRVPPFTYFYLYTVGVAVAYAAFIIKRYDRGAIAREWTLNRSPILQVAFFNTIAYLLVLYALREGTSSYVVALRQLSIVFGVFLGWWLLGETVQAAKRIGVILLVAGCVLVALAR
jgi:drug/metabolite transporter (DMT)-like permease